MSDRSDSASATKIFLAAKKKYNSSRGRRDYKAGFALLREAARLGSIRAHEWLGYVYDYGYGTCPNRRLSLEHYMVAAKAGNANAEYHVGVFYHEGISVRRNFRLAAVWLRRAAEHGDTTAVWALGRPTSTDGACGKIRKKDLS